MKKRRINCQNHYRPEGLIALNIRCPTIEGDFSITQKKKKLFAHCVTNEQCLSFCITLTLVSSQVRTEGNECGLAQCTTLQVRVLKLMEQDSWTSKGETLYLRSRNLPNNATNSVHNFRIINTFIIWLLLTCCTIRCHF
jgi:hypothetical protein